VLGDIDSNSDSNIIEAEGAVQAGLKQFPTQAKESLTPQQTPSQRRQTQAQTLP